MALGEVRPLRRRLAGARYPRLGVHDDLAAGDEQAGLSQRRERQKRRRGITARVGDQLRARHGVSLALGQSIGDAVRQVAGLRIPARTRAGIAEPKGARQIDDADAGVHKGGGELCGGLIRQRQEHDVRLAGERLVRQRRDDAVPHAGERRQAPHCRRRARRHGGGDDNSRMPREQPEQFLTGVACCAGHRHAGGGERGAAGARGDRTQDCMHQKVYLYTQARLHSTKIDE